jgi:hypothetical protein
MRGIRVLAVTTLFAVSLYGQKWQDLCFNNPTASVCNGHNTAIKRQPAAAAPAPSPVSVTQFSSPGAARGGSAQVISVGGIDWHFADPKADLVMGFIWNSALHRGAVSKRPVVYGLDNTPREVQ